MITVGIYSDLIDQSSILEDEVYRPIILMRQKVFRMKRDLWFAVLIRGYLNTLSVGGYSLKRVQQTKCLGVHIDENLT